MFWSSLKCKVKKPFGYVRNFLPGEVAWDTDADNRIRARCPIADLQDPRNSVPDTNVLLSDPGVRLHLDEFVKSQSGVGGQFWVTPTVASEIRSIKIREPFKLAQVEMLQEHFVPSVFTRYKLHQYFYQPHEKESFIKDLKILNEASDLSQRLQQNKHPWVYVSCDMQQLRMVLRSVNRDLIEHELFGEYFKLLPAYGYINANFPKLRGESREQHRVRCEKFGRLWNLKDFELE